MASQLRKKAAPKRTGFLKELQKKNPKAFAAREKRIAGYARDKKTSNRPKQPTAEKQFLETIGSKGGDARFPQDETVVPESAVYKDESLAVVINPPLFPQSYWMPLLSILSQSFTKGFIASSQADDVPFSMYYAFVYMVSALERAVNNAAPLMTVAPKWFVILYQSLQPKKTKFKTGTASYKFDVSTTGQYPFGANPPAVIPWTDTSVSYVFGSPDGGGAMVNGYIQLVVAAGYTLDLGQASYEKLVQYFANEGTFPMWTEVPLDAELGLRFDLSSYAASSPEQGGAVGTSTGYLTEVFSEVYINTPLLSIFTQYELGLYRSFSEARMYGGTGCYTGARLQQLANMREINNKVRPVFKKVDFNEFYEVAALWLAGVLTQASGNILQEDATTPLICPLTVQNFRILLRQAIISTTMEAQSMGQDLRYFEEDAFYPFIVSSGTCGKQLANTMVLPIPLVENIRALMRRTFRAKDKQGQNKGPIVDFVPVWGMWASDIPQITNYTYTNGTGTFPVFSTDLAEMTINLLDGSSTVPPVSGAQTWLDLNGPELVNNVTLWNQFVSSLSANSITLTPIGSEKGISALQVVTMSFVMLNIPPTVPEVLPVSKEIVANKRLSAEKQKIWGKAKTVLKSKFGANVIAQNASPYGSWCTNLVSSNQRFVASAWSECQQYWILPATRTTGVPTQTANYSSYQSEVCEPNFFYLGSFGSSLNVLNPDLFTPTFLRHSQYASNMFKPVAGTPNVWEDYLSGAAATGRGSFLGKIAGSFVGSLVGQAELGGEIGSEIF